MMWPRGPWGELRFVPGARKRARLRAWEEEPDPALMEELMEVLKHPRPTYGPMDTDSYTAPTSDDGREP